MLTKVLKRARFNESCLVHCVLGNTLPQLVRANETLDISLFFGNNRGDKCSHSDEHILLCILVIVNRTAVVALMNHCVVNPVKEIENNKRHRKHPATTSIDRNCCLTTLEMKWLMGGECMRTVLEFTCRRLTVESHFSVLNVTVRIACLTALCVEPTEGLVFRVSN